MIAKICCGRWYVMAILSIQWNTDSDDQIEVNKEKHNVKSLL